MGLKILDAQAYEPTHWTENAYFTTLMDTSDEWIRRRTGIVTRYLSDRPLLEMVQAAVAKLSLTDYRERIRLCLAATLSAATVMPSLAAHAHAAMALPEAVLSADINMACSGFAGALILAEGRLAVGECAVVIGAEKLSDVTDLTDRGTGFLFADGAAAVLVEKTAEALPYCAGTLPGDGLTLLRGETVQMDGPHIYKFATSYLPKVIAKIAPNGLQHIDHVVCHQANLRIIDAVARKTGYREKYVTNVARYGNTSSASIALCLADLAHDKAVHSGESLLLAGFGGGLTYAGTIVKWG